jgi:hypothetical protein
MAAETIISSTQLQESDLPLGEEAGSLNLYDGLHTPFSHDIIHLSDKHKEQIRSITLASVNNYGPSNENGQRTPEPTFIQTTHNIPTLIGRLDCSVDPETGDIIAYELEDSPSGIGITDKLHGAAGNDQFANNVLEHYQAQLGEIPFLIVTGERTHGTDDALVLGEDNYHYEAGSNTLPGRLGEDRLVIVKAIPGVPSSLEGYRHLQERTVCTMESEGDKSYGARIGMFNSVLSTKDLISDPQSSELKSQVLKRALGSMSMGIRIYLDPQDKAIYGKKGTVTQSKLLRSAEEFIAADGLAYTQEFAAPVRITNDQKRGNMILRVFSLIEPGNGSGPDARVIGGLYVARPELIVHGASNSVAGCVVV